MTSWMDDIPSLPGDARRESERAVNLAWADQLQRQAAERERVRRVLAPGPINNYTVRGPYRWRRVGRTLRGVAIWCAFIAAGLLAGAGFSALAGCSLASDSQIDELIATDLTEAVAQAQGFEIKESK